MPQSDGNHFTKLFYYKSFQSAIYGTLKEVQKDKGIFPVIFAWWHSILNLPAL